MEINIENSNGKVVVKVSGKIDTNTAPALEAKLSGLVSSNSKIVLDLEQVNYVSSAGLRVILITHKAMKAKNGSLLITHISDEVMEIFDMTGFSSFLEFED